MAVANLLNLRKRVATFTWHMCAMRHACMLAHLLTDKDADRSNLFAHCRERKGSRSLCMLLDMCVCAIHACDVASIVSHVSMCILDTMEISSLKCSTFHALIFQCVACVCVDLWFQKILTTSKETDFGIKLSVLMLIMIFIWSKPHCSIWNHAWKMCCVTMDSVRLIDCSRHLSASESSYWT